MKKAKAEIDDDGKPKKKTVKELVAQYDELEYKPVDFPRDINSDFYKVYWIVMNICSQGVYRNNYSFKKEAVSLAKERYFPNKTEEEFLEIAEKEDVWKFFINKYCTRPTLGDERIIDEYEY